jgi:hypothetical protein
VEKNKVLPKNLKADVRFEVSQRTYGPECDRELYFH